MMNRSRRLVARAASIALACLLAAPVAAQTTRPAKAEGRAFRYGVCAHLQRYRDAEFAKLIDAIDRLGVDTVRGGVEWSSVQPTEAEWKFETQDKIVDSLASRGVETQSLFGFTARWASTGDPNAKDWLDWNRVTPRREPFLKYVETMVARYKDRVHLWEVWNEPDISFWKSSTSDYTELFNAASAAIAKADPSAKVLNGGFAMVRRPPNMDFVRDFSRAADTSHWNIWAYHDYQTFDQMVARSKENAQAYKATKLNVPIWINEGGFHTLLPGGEQEQASTLAKKMAAAPSLGASAYFWYDLIDDGDKPLDPEHHFGLLRRDFSPKPAFVAYQQAIRELAPRRYAKKLADVGDLAGLWGFVFQDPSRDGENVLVLWREGKGRETPMWIGTADGAGAVTAARSLDGTPLAAPQLDGGLLVTASDVPVYVRLRGTLDPSIRPILSLPDKLAVLPGRANTMQLRVTNPTKHEATFDVDTAADAPAIQLSVNPKSPRIAPGGSAVVTVEARVAAGTNDLKDGKVTVSLRPSAGAPAVEAKLPYVVASAIPKLADASAAAIPANVGLALKLDTADAVVNLFSAEPVDAMHWHGPADLSAAARLAYTDDALYVEVTATDDTHKQNHPGAQLWESDSLQLAISTDDSRGDYLECAVGLGEDGKARGWVTSTPANATLPLGELDAPATCDAKRDGTQTRYRLKLPWKSLGLAGAPPAGPRLSFLVNDDDGAGRKGWVQLSDGIGRAKIPGLFKLFVCDDGDATKTP